MRSNRSRWAVIGVAFVMSSGSVFAESGGSGGASAFDEEPASKPSSGPSSTPWPTARPATRRADTAPKSSGGGCTPEQERRNYVILAVIGGLIALSWIVHLIGLWLKRRVPHRILRLRIGWERPGPRPWEPFEAIARTITSATKGKSLDEKRKALGKIVDYTTQRFASDPSELGAAWEEVVASARLEKRFGEIVRAERHNVGREVLRIDEDGAREGRRERPHRDPLLDEDGDFGLAEGFVVTVLVASSSKRRVFPEAVATPEQLRSAIDALAEVPPAELRALELVWSPAAESDIMTRDDMLRRYPDLAPLVQLG